MDAAISHYDFSSLATNAFGQYTTDDMNALLKNSERATQAILKQVIQYSETRQGVMIFAATVMHAQEILTYLPAEQSALITGDTPNAERDKLINQFKQNGCNQSVLLWILIGFRRSRASRNHFGSFAPGSTRHRAKIVLYKFTTLCRGK